MSKNLLKEYFITFNQIFFLPIVWWVSEVAGFSYGEASWNKFIIVKWRAVDF